ncbi:hypothetical protein TSUD_32130 [Trifolium subterraneum]|uniref:Large ribosomal subunit protein mL45 n=2 Tax=Trifolium TaxID=3898 RepID=A0A2Z6LQM3_TRISU|nr:hypothetical protein TSUD_32130 [Trifolium subterraneum]
MSLKRLQLARTLYRSSQIQPESSSNLFGSCRSYSNALSNGSDCSFRSFHPNLLKGNDGFSLASVKNLTLRSTMGVEFSNFMNDRRMSTAATQRPSTQVRGVLKNAYAIAKLRKTGYSKKQFYREAVSLYKEINTLIANGDKKSLRKAVTEKMFSTLKNEIKQRETTWSQVYWEMVEPVVMVRTLRARMIGVDRKDLNKVFYQLTLEILAKQKFEAYDSKGSVVAGDKDKEVLVRDIWVFEKSTFHPGAHWRLCGRISPKAS